jgi:peptidoglycan/LPS O-acetylase OafA/YrhL
VTTQSWLRYLTLTQIYTPGLERPGLTQTWSLATEAAFYLALPLLAAVSLLGRWRPVRAMLISGSIGVLATAAWLTGLDTGHLAITRHQNWLPTYAVWFSAGMALAVAHTALRTGTAPRWWSGLDDIGAAPAACWSLAGAALLISVPVGGPRDLTAATPAQLTAQIVLFGLMAVLLLIATAFGPPSRTKALFGSPTAHWLGTVSYGLFLWHLAVIELLYAVTRRPIFTGDPVSTFAIALGGGLALAAASYHLLEKPLLTRLTRRRPGPAWPQDGAQPESGHRDQPSGLRSDLPVRVVS